MSPDADEAEGAFGLLACGSSGRWAVDLDESISGGKWSLQLDGPQLYLDFAVEDLAVIVKAVEYLRSRRSRGSLPLGYFGSTSVSVHRDDEDDQRCFLIVGPAARSVIRINLSAEDIAQLIEALEQVLDDLPGQTRTS